MITQSTETVGKPSEEVPSSPAGEVSPDRDVTGPLGEPSMELYRIIPGITAKYGDLAGIGPEQAEQDPDGRRFTGAVRAEEAVHLPHLDGEVDAVECADVAEGFDEVSDVDRGGQNGRASCRDE